MRSSLLIVFFPVVMYSQNTGEYPNTFSSGAAYVKKFDNKSRLFNDWSISVGGGGAFMQSADLTSFYGGRINFGWNAYVGLDKQISHAFGLSLQYQQGQTNQQAMVNPAYGVASANTKYKQISLIGDVNLSNILRRVDSNSPYRWAVHGYAGLGLQGYKTYLQDKSTLWNRKNVLEVNQDLDIASFFYQAGAGVKYKISKLLDIEARLMYIMSGDDEFDGGGWDNTSAEYPYNRIKNTNSDNMVTVNLGLTFKLGKHLSHLAWHDPLEYLENRISKLGTPIDLVVCEKGDNDNDGVCDDWDRELDTPVGARVDGAGVALDVDLDGVIDLYDKCVTVPGPVSNDGCPKNEFDQVAKVNKIFEGIVFALNSDVIESQFLEKLDNAASIIKTMDSTKQYLVIGATDTRGSVAYNKKLSQRRADAVVKYLVSKGVPMSMLVVEGRGQDNLRYPECNPYTKCPEWKNEANRSVYFSEKLNDIIKK
ncbi:OmpA family protein [Riemerella anatipestifer]|nr:OmpA family protein [Riemerella anatipestifer]MDY3325374.1 OmpA family protein [Riemerella anatipestifer]MDY3352636.1 OmpA family protein [Riemerella anatipestifer]